MKQNKPIHPDLKKKMEADLAEAMAVNKFPMGSIPHDFKNWLMDAMENESQRSLETTWPVYKTIVTSEPWELDLAHMGYALNAIESKSMKQMGWASMVRYLELQQAIFDMCTKWNQIVASLKADIAKKYNVGSPIIQSKSIILQ